MIRYSFSSLLRFKPRFAITKKPPLDDDSAILDLAEVVTSVIFVADALEDGNKSLRSEPLLGSKHKHCRTFDFPRSRNTNIDSYKYRGSFRQGKLEFCLYLYIFDYCLMFLQRRQDSKQNLQK